MIDPAICEIPGGGFLLAFDQMVDAIDKFLHALFFGAELLAGKDGAWVGKDPSKKAGGKGLGDAEPEATGFDPAAVMREIAHGFETAMTQ